MSQKKSESKWLHATRSHTGKGGSDLIVVAALIVGFGFTYLASPLVGVPAAGLLFWMAWETEGRLGDAEDAAEKDGLIAPFLKRSDLLAYAEDVGENKAIAEIDKAINRKMEVSPAARNYYKIKRGRSRKPVKPAEPTGKISGYQIEAPAISAPPGDSPFDAIVSAQLTIFVGSMGSGKSSRLGKLIEMRIDRGDFVLLLNPFSKASEWQGLAVAGRSPDNPFGDVEAALIWFCKIVEARSRKQRTDEAYNALEDVHVCLVLEEVTDWASHVDAAALRRFWESSLRTLRQLNLSVALATHAITLAGLGGKSASGYKDAIVRQAEIFKLKSRTNPDKSPGKSPKIPDIRCDYKAANESEFREIEIPESFQPESLDFDFRDRTRLEKFPDWRGLVGLQ